MRYIWQAAKWPKFTWRSEDLLRPLTDLALARGRLLASVAHLSVADRGALVADTTVEDADGTSSIEGVILPPGSVRSSVAHRLGLETAGLPARQRDVDGLVGVLFDATQNTAADLTSERLFGWHAALFPTGYSGMQPIQVGGWRTHPVSVRSGSLGSEQVHFEAPPHERVPAEMDGLLQWWNSPPAGLDGVLRAGLAHLWFETIHPFDDGNGRIGRALADMALAQADRAPARFYSLSRAILDHRKGYYRELEAGQTGSLDVTRWLLWFSDAVSRAVGRSQGQLAVARHRGALRHLAADAGLAPRQLKVLNKLIEAQPEGFQGGLSNANYCKIGRVSKATAARDLAQLVERGLLRRGDEAGRSTRYFLRLEGLR